MNGKIWTGLRCHGIARDGIEIPRDFTGRDFTGQKNTVLHGTGLRYHGILRDGILREEKSTVLHGTGLRYHGMHCALVKIGVVACACAGHRRVAPTFYIVWTACQTGGAFVSFLVALNYFIKNGKNTFEKSRFFCTQNENIFIPTNLV